MSEKIEVQTRTVMNNIHHFHCDGCGKYLGYTTEYEDGYYIKIGELSIAFHFPRGWRRLTKNFCQDCREAFLTKVDESLHGLGFIDD